MSGKVKVKLTYDEEYPVFSLEDFTEQDAKWHKDKLVELDKDFVEEYERVSTKFGELQGKLTEIAINKRIWPRLLKGD